MTLTRLVIRQIWLGHITGYRQGWI